MGSFYFYNQNPSGFCFLVQIRAFSNSKLTGIIKFNNERENEMNSALSSKKKSSCKWPILKKMHSPLFRWVGVSGNIQGSGCLPFSKASRKYSWKANGTRLFASFQQKKNLWGQRNIWKVSRVFPDGIAYVHVCYSLSKGSRKSSWKANRTRLFGSFQQNKKISEGKGTSEKLVVFFRTE